MPYCDVHGGRGGMAESTTMRVRVVTESVPENAVNGAMTPVPVVGDTPVYETVSTLPFWPSTVQ